MIKSKPRAEVTPDFLTSMKEFMGLSRRIIDDENRYASDDAFMKPIISNNKNAMKRIDAINLTDSGLDFEITKLRGLPYSKFGTANHGEDEYIVGQTKPVVINWTKEIKVGKYVRRQYVTVVVGTQTDQWEMGRIPGLYSEVCFCRQGNYDFPLCTHD